MGLNRNLGHDLGLSLSLGLSLKLNLGLSLKLSLGLSLSLILSKKSYLERVIVKIKCYKEISIDISYSKKG